MDKSEIKEKFELVKKDYDIFSQDLSSEFHLEYLNKLSKFLYKIIHSFFHYYCFIPLYAIDKIIDSINLQIDYIPKNIKKVKIPPELQTDYLITNEPQNIDEEIKKEIDNFIEVLHKEFPKELLILFYKNLNSLDVKLGAIKTDPTKDTKTLGRYNVKENKISIINKEDETTIFHELFHVASSYFDPKKRIEYSGFSQKHLGRGINEGYTELLTNRYAEERDRVYHTETYIARIVEKIVGKENMQLHYFSANLKGLINELAKYKSEEEIIKFIQYIDFYNQYDFNKKLIPTKSKKLNICKQYIVEFLRDIRLKKLKFDINNSFLTNKVLPYTLFENEIREIINELYELELITFDDYLSLKFIDKILYDLGYKKEKDINGNIIIVSLAENYELEESLLNNGR